ncbi:MAG: fumarylacetoacetate hydrolase family protein [Pseudomonadota bacterium]
MTSLLFDLSDWPTIPMVDGSGEYPVRRIFCVGRNYAAHAAEMGNEVDREAPFYFTKSPTAAAMSGQTVPYPPGTQNYHHEMELAFAVGAPAFRVEPKDTGTVIHSYCCALDMTRRDLQQVAKDKRRPWDIAKDVEGSAVFGQLTPAAEVGAIGPQRIWLEKNGTVVQDAHLADMIHAVPEMVADLSQYYHLGPGDVILTGTPAGVGPVEAGDVLTGRIDGLEPLLLTIGQAE